MQLTKKVLFIVITVLVYVPLSAVESIFVVEGSHESNISIKKLSHNAALYYAPKGAEFDFSAPLRIFVFKENMEVEKIAVEFKQTEKHALWVWFDKSSKVVVCKRSRSVGDLIIPGSPALDY